MRCDVKKDEQRIHNYTTLRCELNESIDTLLSWDTKYFGTGNRQISNIWISIFYYYGHLSVYNFWQQPLATIECKANTSMNSCRITLWKQMLWTASILMTKTQKVFIKMSDRSHHTISSTSWHNKWSYKYLFLFFLSSVWLLSAYCYEFSSGIEDTIIKGWESLQQNMTFSFVSAWPNIILCLIGGILVEKLVGLRLGLLIVVSSVLLGQIIWAIGGITDKYLIMFVGRFFIGAGNELLIAIDHAFKAVWFKEDLPLAVSIDAAFGRIGGTLATVNIWQFLNNSEAPILD